MNALYLADICAGDISARPFDPLKPDHPLVRDGAMCPACEQPFLAGERPTLIVDPGNPENIAARAEKPEGFINAVALPMHLTCRLYALRVEAEVRAKQEELLEQIERINVKLDKQLEGRRYGV